MKVVSKESGNQILKELGSHDEKADGRRKQREVWIGRRLLY